MLFLLLLKFLILCLYIPVVVLRRVVVVIRALAPGVHVIKAFLFGVVRLTMLVVVRVVVLVLILLPVIIPVSMIMRVTVRALTSVVVVMIV